MMLSESVLLRVYTGVKRHDLMFSHQSNHNQSVDAFTQAKHVMAFQKYQGFDTQAIKSNPFSWDPLVKVLQHAIVSQMFFGFVLRFPVFQSQRKKNNSARCSHFQNDCNPVIILRPKCPVLLVYTSGLFTSVSFFFAHTACYAVMPLMNTRGGLETFYCASVRWRGRQLVSFRHISRNRDKTPGRFCRHAKRYAFSFSLPLSLFFFYSLNKLMSFFTGTTCRLH